MYRGGIPDMSKRKNYRSDEKRFDKELTRFLRYTIFERRDIEKRYRAWGGARLVDVARGLGVGVDVVRRAVETGTHREKGRRYWWEVYEEQIWVGVNWWPDQAVETSLWPPVGGEYFRCPNEWARKEGEGLVEYIQKWFLWDLDCPSPAVVRAWTETAKLVEDIANRGRRVTFHAGPRDSCPSTIKTVDVHEDYMIEGVPSWVQKRFVTGIDKRCVMHLMKQEPVALVVQSVVSLVENDASDHKEYAVVCQHGKHRSVAVVMLVLACVYYNAVVAFHNHRAYEVAREMLDPSWMGS